MQAVEHTPTVPPSINETSFYIHDDAARSTPSQHGDSVSLTANLSHKQVGVAPESSNTTSIQNTRANEKKKFEKYPKLRKLFGLKTDSPDESPDVETDRAVIRENEVNNLVHHPKAKKLTGAAGHVSIQAVVDKYIHHPKLLKLRYGLAPVSQSQIEHASSQENVQDGTLEERVA